MEGATTKLDQDTFAALVAAVEQPGPATRSRIHGPQHWRAVALVGLDLLRAGVAADPLVVLLFALFHDSQRQRDGSDPEHGERAATAARALCAPCLSALQLALLCVACEGHDAGETSSDPTIGACWDADRLNLWRIGRIPNARYLSTAPARTPAVMARALKAHWQAPSWAVLWAQYAELWG
jgi:uncharacterized protein